MSSFIGHTLIGLAIGDNAKPHTPRVRLPLLCSLLALSPDLDYLLLWLLGFHWEPRLTHSLGGALLLAAEGLLVHRLAWRSWPDGRASLLLLAAPLSHLLLDFLVGVHRNPLLWPLSPELVAFAWGVLPSAGRLSLVNVYFWRNLVIELSVLLPVALLISTRGRQVLRARPWRLGLTLLVCACGAAVAFSLPR